MLIVFHYYYLCIANLKLLIMYNKMIFDDFRKWFNKNFTLSLNGKFKGISTLLRLFGEKYFQHFIFKMNKALLGRHGRYLREVGDVLAFVVKGCKIKLYFR